MRTPMQELIDRLKQLKYSEINEQAWDAYDSVMDIAESLLEKEKEVIVNAYKQGVVDEYGDTLDSRTITEAEDYYNDIFNTKDK